MNYFLLVVIILSTSSWISIASLNERLSHENDIQLHAKAHESRTMRSERTISSVSVCPRSMFATFMITVGLLQLPANSNTVHAFSPSIMIGHPIHNPSRAGMPLVQVSSTSSTALNLSKKPQTIEDLFDCRKHDDCIKKVKYYSDLAEGIAQVSTKLNEIFNCIAEKSGVNNLSSIEWVFGLIALFSEELAASKAEAAGKVEVVNNGRFRSQPQQNVFNAIEKVDFDELITMTTFSSAIYALSEQEFLNELKLKGIGEEPGSIRIVMSRFESEISKPAYAICVDNVNKKVIVTVRGTESIDDVQTDLGFEPTEFLNSKAHNLIKTSAENIYKETNQKLFEIYADEDIPDAYELVFTGHSLGAGVSSLLAIYFRDPKKEVEFVGPSVGANAYTEATAIVFASPPVLSEELAKQSEDCVTNIIFEDDIVPRMSENSMIELMLRIELALRKKRDELYQVHLILRPRALLEFEKLVLGLFGKKHSIDTILAEDDRGCLEVVLQNAIEDLLDKSKKVFKKLKKDPNHLNFFTPGKIYHITGSSDGMLKFAQKPSTDFTKIVISDGMIEDHKIVSYRNSLLKLKEQNKTE